jgi:His-Xaa-Ser system protein HxsD
MKAQDDCRTLLKIDGAVYTKEAILETTYKFTDTCYIEIESDEKFYRISFLAKEPNLDLANKMKQFSNALLDQQIRLNLRSFNRELTELVIKKAFFPFQNYEQE